jgi:hypothetical protein
VKRPEASDRRNDFVELRNYFDSNEPIMNFGLNVKEPKLCWINRRVETPDWIRDSEKVMLFLSARFPRMLMDKRQRRQAAKWFVIMIRYFLAGEPCSEIRKELQISTARVKNIVRHIRLASAGARLDGQARTGRRVGRSKEMPKEMSKAA